MADAIIYATAQMHEAQVAQGEQLLAALEAEAAAACSLGQVDAEAAALVAGFVATVRAVLPRADGWGSVRAQLAAAVDRCRDLLARYRRIPASYAGQPVGPGGGSSREALRRGLAVARAGPRRALYQKPGRITILWNIVRPEKLNPLSRFRASRCVLETGCFSRGHPGRSGAEKTGRSWDPTARENRRSPGPSVAMFRMSGEN